MLLAGFSPLILFVIPLAMVTFLHSFFFFNSVEDGGDLKC